MELFNQTTMNLHRNTIIIIVITSVIAGIIVSATLLYDQTRAFSWVFILVTFILVIGIFSAAQCEIKHGKDIRDES